LAGLVRRGRIEAELNGITSDAGTALIIGMMFTVGHGMTRDPRLPWIAGTLRNDPISDPEKRVARLHAKSMTYLDEILKDAT
jgi:hypothetical protein